MCSSDPFKLLDASFVYRIPSKLCFRMSSLAFYVLSSLILYVICGGSCSVISLRLFARTLVLTLLTYLRPSTRWEHGPSIKALHRILPCAMVAISCQVYPIFLASDSTSRRQVFLGRLLFPFPWGFHVMACLVMLDVGFLSV